MPVRYPRVLIVTAPDPSRTVVYDFNDDTQTLATGSKTDLTAADWSFGQLDLLGDPDAVGVEWALQRISFKQTITGTKAAAMARQVSMSRALLTTRFWVEFQLDASTAPVWWHGYRTPPGEVSIEQVYVPGNLPDRWEIAGGIDVDPFSYATRVALTAKTVGNNPTNDATVPSAGYALTTIKGDSPTRLRVQIDYPSSLGALSKVMVACVCSSRSAPMVRVETDTFANGPGVGSGTTTNTNAIGGKVRAATLSATTSPRLVGPLPASGTVLPGRYLVLLRMSANGYAGAPLTLQLRSATYLAPELTPPGAPIPPALTSPVAAYFPPNTTEGFQWIALGVVGINDGLPYTGVAESGVRNVGLYVSCTDPTATANFDSFLLIPVTGADVTSTTVATVDVAGVGPTPGYPLILDGNDEVTWVRGANEDAVSLVTGGGYPTVDPAAAHNVLLVLPMKGQYATTYPTDISRTFSVTVSYHPRNTYLGDGT